MFLRKSSGVAGLLLFGLAITACGSSGNSNSASTTTVPSASSTPAATAPAPTAAQLQEILDTVSSPDKPVADKVAVVVDGPKRQPNLTKLTAALRGYPLSYTVTGITVQGNTANAEVDVNSPHGSVQWPMTWQYVGGTWKLSDAGDCQLLGMAGPQIACS
jgi:hypothetical protein